MDGHRFDEITKALASGSSRRRVLRGLAGGAIGAAAGAFGLRRSAEAACGRYGQDCRRSFCCVDFGGGVSCVAPAPGSAQRRCLCPTETPTRCVDEGGFTFCVDTASDSDNCGACGNACDPYLGEICVEGECTEIIIG